jgi:F-type H+-transporting ATPase subunit b
LLEKSKHQASEIIANATKQASSVVEDAKSVASQEAQRIKTQAHGEIEQESPSFATDAPTSKTPFQSA